MAGFDIIVLLVVGVCAIGGFVRGFVQEVLSLVAWVFAVLAIHYLHTDLTATVYEYVGSPTSSSILAFALLLLVPYAAIKLMARYLSKHSRKSVLGPIDRVLGFGFGATKGVIVMVIGFSVLVLGYDMIWGTSGRPVWIAEARSYQFVDASSKALVQIVAERRNRLSEDAIDSGIAGA